LFVVHPRLPPGPVTAASLPILLLFICLCRAVGFLTDVTVFGLAAGTVFFTGAAAAGAAGAVFNVLFAPNPPNALADF
jgi:hypothetical protein